MVCYNFHKHLSIAKVCLTILVIFTSGSVFAQESLVQLPPYYSKLNRTDSLCLCITECDSIAIDTCLLVNPDTKFKVITCKGDYILLRPQSNYSKSNCFVLLYDDYIQHQEQLSYLQEDPESAQLNNWALSNYLKDNLAYYEDTEFSKVVVLGYGSTNWFSTGLYLSALNTNTKLSDIDYCVNIGAYFSYNIFARRSLSFISPVVTTGYKAYFNEINTLNSGVGLKFSPPIRATRTLGLIVLNTWDWESGIRIYELGISIRIIR